MRPETQKIVDILQAGWTQNAPARNSEGRQVTFRDPSAVCYCLAGALFLASDCFPDSEYLTDLRERMLAKAGHHSLASWNDAAGRTVEQVIELVVSCDVANL
jgi:hypothetical protein